MSDKQDAFVTAIADECVGVPHRYCPKHLLRDVAPPVLDMDRQAQVTMRRTVRGLRAIARRVLAERRHAATPEPPPPQARPQGDDPPRIDPAEAATAAPCAPGARGLATTENAPVEDAAGEVVRGDCAAVRGMLQARQGGPLRPPGVRMREALQDVRDALERHLHAQKGGLQRRC